MSGEMVVLVSCPAPEAETIASALVEENLAACVSILPQVTSVYRWKGEVHREPESLMVIKTNEVIWELLERRLLELHSYEVPEIICLPIKRGLQSYLNWLNSDLVGAITESGQTNKKRPPETPETD